MAHAPSRNPGTPDRDRERARGPRPPTLVGMLERLMIDLEDLRGTFGFGVAGNFAGHLDQAGESADFESVRPVTPEAPKGIFPWYVPERGAGADASGDVEVPAFLRAFPLSTDTLIAPEDESLHLQIEPEVGILANVTYDDDGNVRTLRPHAFGAFNDCSIRRPGASKISEKKNWGPASKGVSPAFFKIANLDADGPTADFRLACFHRRLGPTTEYGIDSKVVDYSFYGNDLIVWMIDRLVNQPGAADTPLEPVGRYLRAAGRPRQVLVGIGATRYTEFGETTFLQPGDESIVVVYDGSLSEPSDIVNFVTDGREAMIPMASVLKQTVVSASHAL